MSSGSATIQNLCIFHEHSVGVFAAEKLGQLAFDPFTSDQAQVFALIERSLSSFRFQGEVELGRKTQRA